MGHEYIEPSKQYARNVETSSQKINIAQIGLSYTTDLFNTIYRRIIE